MQTQQIPGPADQSLTRFSTDKLVTEDKVEELILVEKLIVQEFLGESIQPSIENRSLKVEDLLQKLSQVESGKSMAREKLDFLISHLPFVIKSSEEEYSAMNIKTIAPSKQGGAQCFLVVELCALEVIRASDQARDEPEMEISMQTILNFVNNLPYAKKIKVLD